MLFRSFGSWEKSTQRILLDASVHNPDGTSTSAWGYIRPFNPHAGLDLRFDAKHADVAFIGPFLSELAPAARSSSRRRPRLSSRAHPRSCGAGRDKYVPAAPSSSSFFAIKSFCPHGADFPFLKKCIAFDVKVKAPNTANDVLQ